MDHLPVPENCRSLVSEVPYLCIAPKYDRKGFEGFLERCGLDEEKLLSLETLDLGVVAVSFGMVHASFSDEVRTSMKLEPLPSGWETRFAEDGRKCFIDHNTESISWIDPRAPYFAESIIQEWLWFGLLHEFELACGVTMDVAKLTAFRVSGHVLSTKFLLSYAKAAIIQRLWDEDVPLGIEVGDWVTFRALIGVPVEYDIKPSFQVTQVQDDFNYVIGDVPVSLAVLLLQKPRRPHPRTNPAYVEAADLETLLDILNMTVAIKSKPLTMRDRVRGLYQKPADRLSRALQKAREITNSIAPQEKSLVRDEIVLSIDLLCDAIQRLASMILVRDIKLERPHWHHYGPKFESQMMARHWCPARTDELLSSNLSIQYITSLLPSYDNRTHYDCKPDFCCNQSQPEDFAQHAPGCDISACHSIGFQKSEMIEILRSDGLPGIRKISRDCQPYRYEIANVKGQEFVAISHVWAHGLGNPKANALPQCQLDRLFQFISELASPDALLWLDTLIVPIDGPWKMKSIEKLREVYREADKVLVLDRCLIQVGEDWLEQRLQLLSAEWMMRLWTLQEGRLAADLYIQFRDRAVPISEIIAEQPTADQFAIEKLTGFISSTGQLLGTRFKRQEHIRQTFMDLVVDLSHRSVTDPLDEPICIATLLSLNLEEFKSGRPTMKDVLFRVSELPEDIIFVQSPRLIDPGFRWAPSTLLRSGLKAFFNQNLGTLSADGLTISKDTIIFHDQLELVKSPQRISAMYVVDCGEEGIFVFQPDTWDDEVSETASSAAIIIQNSGHRFENTSVGLLVTSVTKRFQVAYCRFRFLVMMWRWNSASEPDLLSRFSRPGRETYLVGGEFCRQMAFCVD
jgi:hypothetical protein